MVPEEAELLRSEKQRLRREIREAAAALPADYRRVASGRIAEVFSLAAKERAEGICVVVQPLKKNAKFRVESLEKEGYTQIRKIYGDTEL